MSARADSVQPPRMAVWLVTLFTPAENVESILGDLLEEFSSLSSKQRGAYARSWYWRQSVKTIAYVVLGELRSAPWSSAAAVVVGLLLIKFGFLLYGKAFNAVLDPWVYGYLSDLGRDQPSRNIGAEYMWWITRAMLIGRALVATLAGGIVALGARGREMTATTALFLFMIALGVAQSLLMLAAIGSYPFTFLGPQILSAMTRVFADAIPTIVGGAIVRMRRTAGAPRFSIL